MSKRKRRRRIDIMGLLEEKDTKGTTNTTSYWYSSCNHAIKEVIPGLFLGGKSQAIDMIKKHNVHVLVPLDSLSSDIWDTGWLGNVLYIPIQDYSVLPREVAINRAQKIVRLLKSGKRVGMFCMAGHGRTGYFASIVIGMMGYEDPIAIVRDYCSKTIESRKQIDEIAEILGNEKLKEYEGAKEKTVVNYHFYSDGYDIWRDYYGRGRASSPGTDTAEMSERFPLRFERDSARLKTDALEYKDKNCKDCFEYWETLANRGSGYGECLVDNHPVSSMDFACKCFVKIIARGIVPQKEENISGE